jgi:hypothetical protein
VNGGGTIDNQGVFDAMTAGGPFTVTAQDGTIKGMATVIITAGGNLALNRPAFASSVEKAGLDASKAVDGLSTTRWSSAFSDPQWIYVDLGAIYTIDRVVLNWEGAYGAQYQIQVSNDGVNWNTVFTESSGNGGVDDITFGATTARYVRMYGTGRGTPWGYSLYEFEVYQ